MRRRAGFTFFEIVIVITVIGLLIGVALPSIKGSLRRTRLKTSARDVTVLMRFARDVAVLTESYCEVRFSPEEDAYQLVVFDKKGERVEVAERRRSRRRADETNPLLVSADLLQPHHLPDGIHFAVIYTAADLTEETDLPRVIFYPDGSASPATIAMQDEEERAIRVEVYRTTGMTRVEQGLPLEQPQAQRLYYGHGN